MNAAVWAQVMRDRSNGSSLAVEYAAKKMQRAGFQPERRSSALLGTIGPSDALSDN